MPASALATSAIESALNTLLSLDPDSPARLKPLNGQRLYLYISPLPDGLCLAFSDQIDVLSVSDSASDIIAGLDKMSCCIQTDMTTLPSLTDTSALTRLIQQQKLQLDGALSIAQHTSALFQSLDIDWEEHIAAVTGDVVANQLTRTAAAVKAHALKRHAQLQKLVGNAVTEEKRLAAHRLAVMHFSDEVSQLRDDVARAEARLRRLEEKAGK
ncbi:ubiquinone biosynthesis accessory factor UbiJ [Alteromonas sp. CYL-A6]|uniref:ubiquinone biosynthesis accessory factor UbiJ n=1 Tax=Alteromonas nitratireducens TaxID=3390813 RepID=UPI0034B08D5B